MTSLRPFFGFYGGKWRDARNYPIPQHSVLVEPFCGSAGYSLRYPDREVILCDIDPVIVGVWQYLLRVSPAEVLALPDVPLDGCVDDLKVCPEARWLIGFWLNRAPSAPRKRPSAWMRSGVRPGSFWGQRVRLTIASQLQYVRHWNVMQVDYREIFSPEIPATWFVDPPYAVAGKHYTHGARGIDYAHLAKWCQKLNGQVIVCENTGASWLPFKELAEVKTTRAGKRSAEVVWTK